MGNNKFVFNLEWYAILMDYPAEVRLEVYEAMFRYAHSGTLTEMKPLAKMAFSFIRKEMDYNRERYEDTIEKRREAGRKSAESRRQMSTKRTNVQSSEQNEQNEQMSTKRTNVQSSEQNEQMLALFNINDNVNVYDNMLSTTTNAHMRENAVADAEYEELIDDFFKNTEAVDAFCRNNLTSPEQLHTLARQIVTEWSLTGQTHKDDQDARRHLLSQLRIKINRERNGTISQDRFSRCRGVDTAAKDPEDYTGEI